MTKYIAGEDIKSGDSVCVDPKTGLLVTWHHNLKAVVFPEGYYLKGTGVGNLFKIECEQL